jgi:hypothetical protein
MFINSLLWKTSRIHTSWKLDWEIRKLLQANCNGHREVQSNLPVEWDIVDCQAPGEHWNKISPQHPEEVWHCLRVSHNLHTNPNLSYLIIKMEIQSRHFWGPVVMWPKNLFCTHFYCWGLVLNISVGYSFIWNSVIFQTVIPHFVLILGTVRWERSSPRVLLCWTSPNIAPNKCCLTSNRVASTLSGFNYFHAMKPNTRIWRDNLLVQLYKGNDDENWVSPCHPNTYAGSKRGFPDCKTALLSMSSMCFSIPWQLCLHHYNTSCWMR